jgi:tyrosine-specific transport protein
MGKTFIALSALLGTIIGAGIFGLPYVIMKSGFLIGLLHLGLTAVIITIIMLYLGEIAQRTKTIHQLPGYAQKYLGTKGKTIMFIALIVGIYSALLAYLIAEGSSLSYIIFGNSSYSFQMGLLFWLALSFISYYGIEALRKGEPIGVILVFILVISISVYFTNKIDISNLSSLSLQNVFAPFGVVLFAYLGFSIIPEVKRILGEHQKPMKKIIISAYLLAFLIYAVFTAIVLGFRGALTPEIATIALGKPFILLGVITMFNAYLALSTAMMDTFKFDFNKSRKTAWIYTIAIPMILYGLLEVLGKASFTAVIGIGGVISGGITAILILAMVKNAKKHGDSKPSYSMPYSKWLAYLLTAVFIIGAITEIINIAH